MMLIKEIEKRYDVDFQTSDFKLDVYVVRDMVKGEYESFRYKWNDMEYETLMDKDRIIETLEIDLNDIKSVDDIYKILKIGFNSWENDFYKNKKKPYPSLHPMIPIGINYKPYDEDKKLWENETTKVCYFRMDNPMVREMFYDTQGLVGYDFTSLKPKDLHPDGVTKGMDLDEMKEFFNHRLNEHKEYLKYCVYGLSYKWYQIYDKKCYER